MAGDELKLHPDADAEFWRKAEMLIPDLTTRASSEDSARRFRPQRFVSQTIGSEDIGRMQLGPVDALGRQIARYFVHEGSAVGLEEGGYQKLCLLTEAMQRTPALRDKVSERYLADLIFEWAECKHTGVPVPAMTEYVLGKVGQFVDEVEVWTPRPCGRRADESVMSMDGSGLASGAAASGRGGADEKVAEGRES